MIDAEDFLRRHQPVSPQKPRAAGSGIAGKGIDGAAVKGTVTDGTVMDGAVAVVHDVVVHGAVVRDVAVHGAVVNGTVSAVERASGNASGPRVERDGEICPSVSASNDAKAYAMPLGVAVFGSARGLDGACDGDDASFSRSSSRWGGGVRRRRSSRPSSSGTSTRVHRAARGSSHAAEVAAERGESYDASTPSVQVGDEEACREAALRILDAAAKPSRAMVARLVDKGYARSTAEAVVARLVELRLIDDDAFAEDVLRACHARMMGARGAYRELLRKDVSESMARSKVDRAEKLGLFEENAWELGRTVSMKTAGMDRERRLRRFWSAGGRKGHDPEVLRRVAHELFA